ncbi:MAG TPA: DUF427 domain-containing protein, partial [Dehalococcoidia bacterium]|nr:DUF427 domain-containing protein [Dehalococcoidia bacterium]
MTTAETKLTTNFRNQVLHIEPTQRWVRAMFNGVTVADSKRAILVRSTAPRRGRPTYYFPVKDVRMDLLTPSGEVKNDQHLGDATYYNLTAGDRTAEGAAWTFGESSNTAEGFDRGDAPDLRGYVAFVWEKLDSWFEEAEEIFAHVRDPYK